jgi:peptide/nickel transport system permease protein
MYQRIGRAVFRAVVTIAMVAVLNFFLFRVAPGDPAQLLLSGARVALSPAQIEAQRHRWGLDRPLFPDQVVAYISSTLRGDLGYSFKYRGRRVSELLLERLLPTIALVGTAQCLAIIGGVALGAFSGWRRGRSADRAIMVTSLTFYSTPLFWLGMLLVLIFSTWLGWLPAYGLFTPGAPFTSTSQWLFDGAMHLILPVLAVALGLFGQYVLVTRAAISDVLSEDYMLTARAKGLSGWQMFTRHALRNSMLPILTLVTLNLGYVVAGAITVEAVFGWPGIGALTVEAQLARDYPVLQGIFLLLGTAIVLANLVTDIAYSSIDPRVRAGKNDQF